MSESYQYTGRVLHVGQIETVGTNGFQKCQVVVTDDDPNYPQEVPFVFAGKKADTPHKEGICEGDKVTVHFEVRGRPWKDRWFAEVTGWKISRHGARAPTQPPQDDKQQAFEPDDIIDEDVPF